MSGVGSGYDLSVTTFSPEGRVFQVEYAGKATDNGVPCVGVCCKDGAILAVEKPEETKMMLPQSNRRIFTVSRHCGMAVPGKLPDGRQIVSRAHQEAEQYKRFYGETIPTKVLCDRLANFCHVFSLYWSLRPLGSAALTASFDDQGPHIYLSETNGVSYRYYGIAVGKGRQGIKTELERLKLGEMTTREALKVVCKCLMRQRDESSNKKYEIELAWISEETGREFQRVPEDLAKQTVEDAKKEIEQEDSDSDMEA
ncbi:subunit alpha type-3 of proteasome [Chloropicon roscoffensis]|uniref:Proteasome subunit alpha type n=1 Tax=Chloropicon roscoffensis TaxID=1461544 RepID=A0AAX4NYX1_9CHLO